MKLKMSWIVILSVVVALFLGDAARADIYMKQNRHMDEFTVMGQTQPEKNEIVEYWFTKGRVRIDTGDLQSTIIDLDEKVMYVLNHEEKTYSEVPVEFGKMLEEAVGDQEDEEAAKAEEAYRKMAESMIQGMEVKVTDSGETKKIKDWGCRKYVVDLTLPMGASNAELWATKDIKVDPKAYWTAANAMMASQKGFEKIVEEMKKIDGVVVQSVTTAEVMGVAVKSTEELIHIEEKSAPVGAFDIPKDYKETKHTGMMMK
jgi:hypothetical protein